MKIVLLFLLFDIFGLISLPASDANAKFSQNDFYVLREKSILRGHYKDVASQSNGAILSSARANIFVRPTLDNSCLRNQIYFSDSLDRQTESIINEGLTQRGVTTVKFPDSLVSKVKLYNKNGNNFNDRLSVIKIQAYYAF